jgi:hypothetical protein
MSNGHRFSRQFRPVPNEGTHKVAVHIYVHNQPPLAVAHIRFPGLGRLDSPGRSASPGMLGRQVLHAGPKTADEM